jgi:uncharacterized RmlC-like cupin family protein
MEIVKDEGFVTIRAPEEILSKQRLPYFVGISGENTGATGISMNLIVIPPGKSAQAHSHSNYESAIYVIKGQALCKYGEGLAKSVVLEAGDFQYIGPYVWHQPINLSETEEVIAIVARNDPEEQEHVELYKASNDRR